MLEPKPVVVLQEEQVVLGILECLAASFPWHQWGIASIKCVMQVEVEHNENIGHSPVNMWKVKVKQHEGKGNDNRMLRHALPMFMTALLSLLTVWQKLSSRQMPVIIFL